MMATATVDTFDEPVIQPVSYHVKSSNWQQLLTWRKRKRQWRLKEDWIFWCETLSMFIKIPARFTFDGASVPKLLSNIVAPCDGVFYGAIVHDFMYRFDQLIVASADIGGRCMHDWHIWDAPGKKEADRLLRALPKQFENVDVANSIAYALRLTFYFAWKSWRKKNLKLTSPYPDPNDPGLLEFS